jgi:hypothetical protein
MTLPNPINATTFKNRFHRFINVPDGRVEFAIEEAMLSVDATWQQYQTVGLLYMTAHILMVEIMRAASGTGQELASESFAGVLSVTYKPSATPSETDLDDLSTTYYGQRVQDIMARVFTAVAIV